MIDSILLSKSSLLYYKVIDMIDSTLLSKSSLEQLEDVLIDNIDA